MKRWLLLLAFSSILLASPPNLTIVYNIKSNYTAFYTNSWGFYTNYFNDRGVLRAVISIMGTSSPRGPEKVILTVTLSNRTLSVSMYSVTTTTITEHLTINPYTTLIRIVKKEVTSSYGTPMQINVKNLLSSLSLQLLNLYINGTVTETITLPLTSSAFQPLITGSASMNGYVTARYLSSSVINTTISSVHPWTSVTFVEALITIVPPSAMTMYYRVVSYLSATLTTTLSLLPIIKPITFTLSLIRDASVSLLQTSETILNFLYELFVAVAVYTYNWVSGLASMVAPPSPQVSMTVVGTFVMRSGNSYVLAISLIVHDKVTVDSIVMSANGRPILSLNSFAMSADDLYHIGLDEGYRYVANLGKDVNLSHKVAGVVVSGYYGLEKLYLDPKDCEIPGCVLFSSVDNAVKFDDRITASLGSAKYAGTYDGYYGTVEVTVGGKEVKGYLFPASNETFATFVDGTFYVDFLSSKYVETDLKPGKAFIMYEGWAGSAVKVNAIGSEADLFDRATIKGYVTLLINYPSLNSLEVSYVTVTLHFTNGADFSIEVPITLS